MKPFTKAQRAALKRVYDRQPLVLRSDAMRQARFSAERWANFSPSLPQMTYLQFRRLAFQSYDCVMVPWCGMWLGIEPDGYTHS